MALPVAAIVCIALACWVVVILLLFALYKFLKARGSCECDCKLCGEEGGGCCSCCISLSDACNCCNPSVNGCLDRICPGNKKISCADIILCQCCANPGEEPCCLKVFPCCHRDFECCGQVCPCCRDNSECCDFEFCSCCPKRDRVNCCCLEIRVRSKSERNAASSAAATYTTKSKPKSDRQRSKLSTGSRASQRSINSSVSFEGDTDTLGTARSISHVQLITDTDLYERTDKHAQKRAGAKVSRDEAIISNVKRSKPAVSDKDKISPSRALPPRKARTSMSKTKPNISDHTSLSRTLPPPPRDLPSLPKAGKTRTNSCDETSFSRTLQSPTRPLPLKPKVGCKDKSGAVDKQKDELEKAGEMVKETVPKVDSKSNAGAIGRRKSHKENEAVELVEVPLIKEAVPLHMYGHQGAVRTWDHNTSQGVSDLTHYPYQSGVSGGLSETDMAPGSMHAHINWNYTQNSFVGAESNVEAFPPHPVLPRRPLPKPSDK